MISRLRTIMRNDAGVNGDAQRIEQIGWILFLKIYDAREAIWEIHKDDYTSIIPKKLRWRNWAIDKKDGEALTGEGLLKFVNEELFPHLKSIEVDERTPMSKIIVKNAFEDAYNYMKDGVLLRQVINVIDEVDFTDYNERHAFNDIYETMLKELQSAGSSGEYYTPRAITDFMVGIVDPSLDDKIADFACGTGGFLTSTLNYLYPKRKTTEDKEKYDTCIYGIEKKPLPHLLCITNMMLHDIDEPSIFHDNSLENNVRDYRQNNAGDCFDVVLMNPPFGGNEKDSVKNNFPTELRSSETADLFVSLILYRLKREGRVGIVLPDGFLFGDDVKARIKEKLFDECNVHTIIRLPKSVFAPYTSISTNIIFFDKTDSTKETWFYRLDMPSGYKNFSKTKPIKVEHLDEVVSWIKDKTEIFEGEYPKAKKYSMVEIKERNYNIDLCGYPNEEQEILEPMELIEKYHAKKATLNKEIDDVLSQITNLLNEH